MKTLLTLIFLLVSLSAEAATYWVSKTATGSPNCVNSATDPGNASSNLTIAEGLACMTGGDTLMIGDGTYVERIVINQIPSGTSASYTKIFGVNVGGATLRPTSIGGSLDHVIHLARNTGGGLHYAHVKNLRIDATLVVQKAIRVSASAGSANASDNIIIESNEIFGSKGTEQDSSGDCISLHYSSFITIRGNKIYDCGENDTTGHSHGMYISSGNNIIEYNEVYNSFGHGIHGYSSAGTSHDNIYRFNYVHDNASRGLLIGSGDDNLANNNIAANNGADSFAIGFGGTNNRMYNNTGYNSGSSCIEIRSGTTNSIAKNNYCLESSGHAGTNTIDNAGTGTTGTCGNNGNVCNTNTTHLIDVANGRFSPSTAGAATLVDQGVNITGFSPGKFVGAAPDVGALEAPILASRSVEDGDASNTRVNFDLPSQAIRNGVGLKGCTTGNWAVVVAGSGATENGCTFTQTGRVNIGLASAVTIGQSVTVAYTRGTLTDNVCIGGDVGGCKDAEVLTFTAQTVTNNVGAPSGAVLDVAHFQCLDLYSNVGAAVKSGVEDTDCDFYPGGFFALAILVQGTTANPDSSVFVTHVDRNAAGSWPALTDTGTATVPAFALHPASGFADGQAVPTAIITNPQGTYVAGQVVAKQSSAPSVDLVQDSAFTMIVMGQVDQATAVADRFCFQPRLVGGVAINYSKTPCGTVRSPGAHGGF